MTVSFDQEERTWGQLIPMCFLDICYKYGTSWTLLQYFQVFCQGTATDIKAILPFSFRGRGSGGLSIRLGGLGECKKTSYNVNSCIYKQQFLNRPALLGNNLILLKSDFKTFK